MEPRVCLVTLAVADVARSRRFYVDGLGWPTVYAADDVVFVQVGHGVLLALWGSADLAADMGVAPAPPGGTAVVLAHNVASASEVSRAVAELVMVGGRVVKPVQRAAFGGTQAYVADPDGHVWEVAHNPGWHVADDGTVTLQAPSAEQ